MSRDVIERAWIARTLAGGCNNDGEIIEAQVALAKVIWPRLSTCFVFVAVRRAGTEEFRELVISLENLELRLAKLLENYPRRRYDIYFCPNRFDSPTRRKEFAIENSVLWCDIDAGNPANFIPRPNILIETSPGRFQGIWLMNELVTQIGAEHYSRALAYRFGGDRNGWSITKYLRLPGTFNHKPQYDRPAVKLVSVNWKLTRRWPSLRGVPAPIWDATQTPPVARPTPREDDKALLKRFRRDLHPRVRALLSDKKAYEKDRSKAIYEMIVDLRRVGATPSEIASLVGHSAYFISKHGNNVNKLNAEINRMFAKARGQP